MANGLDVPPTKSALLQLQRQIGFLRQGHDLLERKQELLIRLLNKHLQRYQELRKQTEDILQQAHHSLVLTYLRTGERVLHHAVAGRGAARRSAYGCARARKRVFAIQSLRSGGVP